MAGNMLQDPVDWSDVNLQDMPVAFMVAQQLSTGGCSDFCAFKFLLRDVVDDGPMERIKSWEELLEMLIDQFDGKALIPELLYHIQRNDVLTKLGLSRTEVSRRLDRTACPYLDPYRLMLHNISQGLTDRDLKSLKFISGSQLSPAVKQTISCGHGLFSALEKQELIQRTNLEFLIKILSTAKLNQLVRKVRTYSSFCVPQGPSGPLPQDMTVRRAPEGSVCPPGPATGYPQSGYPQSGYPQSGACGEPAYHTSVSVSSRTSSSSLSSMGSEIEQDAKKVSREQLELELKTMHEELEALRLSVNMEAAFAQERYPMTSRPRGICLIVNVQKFFTNKSRQGSEKDCEELKRTFDALEFQVEDFVLNCTEDELTKTLEKYVLMNHEWYDCFVCCLMSHGSRGQVVTTDDKAYSIEKIMRMFDGVNCPTLAGKPKLFFVQACQGTEKMLPAFENDLEEDAPVGIPAMSDFVLSLATFPGHSAFRSKKQGSWYVMALCEVLQECSEKMHLADMLIEVNNRVAEAKAGVGETFYKQCPTPTITLRKALWLKKNKAYEADG